MFETIRYVYSGKFIARTAWKHSERVIDSYEWIFVTRGTVCLFVDQTEYVLQTGDVLRIDPGLSHGGTYTSPEPVEFFWIHFLTEAPQELPARHFHLKNTARTELLCRQLLHCANTRDYPPESTDCLCRLLAMELLFQNRVLPEGADRLYAGICEWVRVNCDLPLKVSDVAAHFHYNPDYINRIFRQHYAEGLKAYIDKERIDRIKKDLMDSSLTLAQIAQMYGFSEYKYFLKYFKRHAGVSPTIFRHSYYNIHINNH